MEITVIHGQAHQGSTYHISQLIKENICTGNAIIHEYFMNKDTPGFCVGCFHCIVNGEQYCPHAKKVQEIALSMERSDVIIIDSPTYCFEMSGQLKTLFDHYGYMWLSHRPRKEMFHKIGIVVSTDAGAGSGRVANSIKNQMFWWGIPKIYRFSFHVGAMSWESVSHDKKLKITNLISKRTNVIATKIRKVKPSIKTKVIFTVMSKMQKGNTWNLTDHNYWKENGWLQGEKPWKQE